MVATSGQTKKVLSYFYPKKQVQDDGIHTKPLNLKELMQCNKVITSDAMQKIFVRCNILLVFHNKVAINFKYDAVIYILSLLFIFFLSKI